MQWPERLGVQNLNVHFIDPISPAPESPGVTASYCLLP
jgi:hypothetical protein